jgi:hypothetical protein
MSWEPESWGQWWASTQEWSYLTTGLQSGNVKTLESTSTTLQRLHGEPHLLQRRGSVTQEQNLNYYTNLRNHNHYTNNINDQKLQLHFDKEIVYFSPILITPTPCCCTRPLQCRNLHDVHDAITQTPKIGPRPVRKQKQTPQHLSEGPPQKLHDMTGEQMSA